jgi:hypothetical protein
VYYALVRFFTQLCVQCDGLIFLKHHLYPSHIADFASSQHPFTAHLVPQEIRIRSGCLANDRQYCASTSDTAVVSGQCSSPFFLLDLFQSLRLDRVALLLRRRVGQTPQDKARPDAICIEHNRLCVPPLQILQQSVRDIAKSKPDHIWLDFLPQASPTREMRTGSKGGRSKRRRLTKFVARLSSMGSHRLEGTRHTFFAYRW